jgi:hypothetical protein
MEENHISDTGRENRVACSLRSQAAFGAGLAGAAGEGGSNPGPDRGISTIRRAGGPWDQRGKRRGADGGDREEGIGDGVPSTGPGWTAHWRDRSAEGCAGGGKRSQDGAVGAGEAEWQDSASCDVAASRHPALSVARRAGPDADRSPGSPDQTLRYWMRLGLVEPPGSAFPARL